MDADELAHLSAVDHAEAVRSGQITARTGVVAALQRIHAANPRLNAFTQVLAEEALEAAERLDAGGPGHDGRLAGVPVAIKAESEVAGQVTTYGGRGNTTPAATDSESVRRLRAAGAIVVGITSMPEFGQFPFTESVAFGVTRNPRAATRTPGGSSGGSAAAVAAGLVPVAMGGDGGGSIRIPSSCCGLVGLKPVRGRVSAAPQPAVWDALGTVGPLTRTVADTAAVYDVISGNVDVDRYRADLLPRSFADSLQDETPRRVAVVTRANSPAIRVPAEVVRAVTDTADRLAALGHHVEVLEERWPFDGAAFVPQFLAALHASPGLVEHPERLERRTRTTARMGAAVSGPALRAAQRAGEKLREKYAGHDVVLSPTLGCLPPELGQLDAAGSVRAMLRAMPMIAFTSLANVTGQPAISLPVAASADGTPIGVQLLGVQLDETVPLALAAQLERRTGWS